MPLLIGGEARGLPGVLVTRVAFQRAGLGHPMDDIVITGVDPQGRPATLAVQAKRTLAFTASDAVFAEVVALACRSAPKPEFLTTRYELAVAVARSSTKIEQHIQEVLRWARDYQDPVTFFNRLNQDGVASQGMRDFVIAFRQNMRTADAPHGDEDVWRLLSRFQVLAFDFEQPGSLATLWAKDRCIAALSPEDAHRAPDLWDSLRLIALETNAAGGDLDRPALHRRLLSERSYRLADDLGQVEPSQKSGDAEHPSSPASSRRPVANMQPHLLDNVVDRPTIRSAATKHLLGTPSAVALRGMGGCGKTVVATALAHDARIIRHFPDGVLWATLGQSAQIANAIVAVLAALGVSAPLGDAAAASALLRSELSKRRCLLVLDDVWSLENVQPLLPGKGDSRVLITTRDKRICQELRAHIVEVGPLERKQSIALLRNEIGTEQTSFDPDGAEAFAARVGDLALALRLGAVQVRDGRSFGELQEAMNEASSALSALDADTGELIGDDEDRRRQLSLGACFDVSIRTLAPEIRRAFFLLGILRDDETIDAAEARPMIDAASDTESANVLRVLARKALLLDSTSEGKPRWHMHDLIHDHARSAYSPRFRSRYADGIPATLQEAHLEWLERCWKGGDWSDCADVRYVDRNLAWHAQMAARPGVVHSLMREQREGKPSWLHRLTQSQLAAQFSADAQRAAELAHRSLVEASKPPVQNYVDLLWASVARASQVSKAKKTSPPLLARLVSEGTVGLQDGLAQIRMQDDLTRAWSYGWLLPHLPENERTRAENALFKILTDMLRQVVETSALDAVAENASPSLRRRLIKFGASVSAQAHAAILEYLLPYEPDLSHASLAEFARRRWSTKSERRGAYSRLLEAGLKPPGTTPDFLIALSEEPDRNLLEYLINAIGYLPDHNVGPWLELLWQSAPSALLAVVQRDKIALSDFLLKEVRLRAMAVDNPLTRASLMATTARCLPSGERAIAEQEAADQLCAIQEPDWRVPLQIFRASRSLSIGARESLQINAWLRARDVGFDKYGASNFADLANSLTPTAALKAAELIETASAKARIHCLPHLIAASPASMTRTLTELLAETTREYGGFADLKPCIHLIPSDLLPPLLTASTALGPRDVVLERLDDSGFASMQPPWCRPTETTWPMIFLWTTQSDLVQARTEEIEKRSEKLSVDVQGFDDRQLLAFFSEALVKAGTLDREKLCGLIEAIAIPLGQVFDRQQLEALRVATERACSLYA